MRLTCPTCSAQYEVSDGRIAVGGQHVQCTACHTRWFSRPPARPAPRLISEDEIIARLESRRQGPRPVAEPRPAAAPARPLRRQSGTDFAWEGRLEEPTPPATPSLRLVEPAAKEDAAPEPATADAPGRPEPDADPATTEPGSDPGPAEAAPEPAAAPAPPRRGPRSGQPAARSSPRLDLDPPPAPAAVATRPRRRHLRGLLAGLALVALPVAAYVAAPAVSENVPALAPLAQSYVALIDDARLTVEARLAPLVDDVRAIGRDSE